jgi:RNA polymerase sigma factor (TIGR02999 family)
VSAHSSNQVTELLVRWKHGDQGALRALLPLVYDELQRIAHYRLKAERVGHTLQSTALVHEAYLRLVGREPLRLDNRAHFFAVASHLMRQILVDYARSRHAARRDGRGTLTLQESATLLKTRNTDLIALDDALNGLARLDPRQSRIVELRFFGGLSAEETSQVLGISPATVKRDWIAARVWLYDEVSRRAERSKRAGGSCDA